MRGKGGLGLPPIYDGEEYDEVHQVGGGAAHGARDECHAWLEVKRLEQPHHEEQHCTNGQGERASEHVSCLRLFTLLFPHGI